MVAPLVSEPLDTETSTFPLARFSFAHIVPIFFLKTFVNDDASNARLLHDFLHNCSEGRLATSLSILFGNSVEKIAEKLSNTTYRYQTYSRLTGNKFRISENKRKIVYQNIGNFSLHLNVAVQLRFEHARKS